MTRFHSLGKQVLDGVAHYADACSNEAAEAICSAMNRLGYYAPPEPIDTQPPPVISKSHAIRQESDEYACSCGMRWATDEGEEHP